MLAWLVLGDARQGTGDKNTSGGYTTSHRHILQGANSTFSMNACTGAPCRQHTFMYSL